jgi:hypothetical protein
MSDRAAALVAGFLVLAAASVTYVLQGAAFRAAAEPAPAAAETPTGPAAAPLRHPRPTTHTAVPVAVRARQLEVSDQPGAAAELRRLLLQARRPADRLIVVTALAERARPEDAAELKRLAGEADAKVALAAAGGLVNLGRADDALPLLVALARRGVPALRPLVKPYDMYNRPRYQPQALPYCREAVQTLHARVRIEAAEGLLKLGKFEEGIAALEPHLAAGADIDTRLEAVAAFLEAKPVPAVRAVIERLLADPDPRVAAAAQDVLNAQPPLDSPGAE